ncbi:hypothetical protein PLESTB_001800400 [Pleodorina starrii]|uniref:TPR-like protein n=1 Tax=Pleodorina starrii TaxID=330485 RepID=A0A9W6C0L5_9CHLO|nr:hypothetical protein PLESTM_001929300 [Pleodorina starrii]GLC61764.1 hypothetical protein PLESTB_001800400 [Pleodorina starrii]GLC67922.1 hypothetical protein PLESTF_000623300 [Pleodorina starrii]
MAKGKGAKKGGGPRAPAARVTPQQLYEQAQLAIQYQDYDSARTALRKAAKMDPKNVEYLDALGALLAEIGPEDEAVEVLKKSVSLSPDVGYEKYLYLGQLLEEPGQALAATRKGVQVLQAQHAAAQAQAQAASSPAVAGLSKALSGALCSLSEMLLAHAQMQQQQQAGEAGAGGGVPAAVAEEVEHFLALASTADPSSPEPGQALASLRYEQGRAAEALEALRRSMALWYTPSTKDDEEEEEEAGGGGKAAAAAAAGGEDADMADADGGGDNEEAEEDSDGDDSDDDDDEEDDGPSYEFRLECAKLLLELDETTTTAIDVLEGLIEEDDRVPDAWHLLALSYYSGHQYSEAAAVLAKGQALLATLGAGPGDEITEVFADLESAIKEAMALEQQHQHQQGEQQQRQ